MEEGWNLTPILIPLAALLVGWAIGFFDSNMRTSKKIKQADESAQIAIKQAENKIAEAQAKIASVTANPVTVDDPGLLRIRNENGQLTLDLDGVRVNPSTLTTEQRKRLIEMLNIMRPWLEGKPAPTPAPMPSHPAKPTPAPTSVTSPPPQPVTQPRVPAPVPSASAKKKKDNEPEAAPASIVGQINAILQNRIADTALGTRGISLMESLSGGVNVYVGVTRYEAIDDVPDEEIKAAIRAAIAEWEMKYTPGL